MKNIILLLSLISGVAIAGSFGGSTVPPGTGSTTFLRNGAMTIVSQDTVTPLNSRPLPVQLAGAGLGAVNQGTPNTNANAWPVKITDGTNVIIVTPSGELQTIVTSALPAGTNNIGSLLDITGTISLPTGASTAAKQDTGNTSLSSIDGKLNSLGQKTSAGSVPVTIASDQGTLDVSVSSSVLPTGAATSAKQDDQTTSIDAINTTLGTPMQNSGGSVTANAGTNLNTSALALESGGHLDNLDTKIPPQGQALEAASIPVVLPAAQITTLTPPSSVTVTQATGTNLHSVIDSGTVTVSNPGLTDTQLRASAVPVSAAALPLPSGASTSALQTSGNSSLTSIDGKIANNFGVSSGAVRTASQIGNASGAADFGAGNSSAQTQRVVISTDQSAIPVSGSITATNPSVSTTGTAVPGSATMIGGSDGTNLKAIKVSSTGVQAIDATQLPTSLGQKTMANSLAVVLSSDQTSIPVTGAFGGSSYRFSSFFAKSGTWVCPAGVTEVILIGSGGGGGGGGGGGSGGTCNQGATVLGTNGIVGSAGATGGNTTFVSGAVTRTFTGYTGGAAGTAGAAHSAGTCTGSDSGGDGGNADKGANIAIGGSSLNSIFSNRVGNGSIAGAGAAGGSNVGGASNPSGKGGLGGSAYATTQRVTVVPGNTYTITIGSGGLGGAGGQGGNGGSGATGPAGAAAPSGTLSIFKPTYAITQSTDVGFDGVSGVTALSGNSVSVAAGASGAGGGSGGRGADGFLTILWDDSATP